MLKAVFRCLGGVGAAPAAEAAAPAEEKTEFDIKLTGFDAAAKVKVIKEVRSMTTLGLKEAKELVRTESPPTLPLPSPRPHCGLAARPPSACCAP